MIPLVAVIGLDTRSQRKASDPARFRIWFPLVLVWLLLLPFMLLLVPALIVACQVVGISPLRTLAFLWHIFTGLRGTHIEVNDKNAAVLVRIY